MLQKNLKIPTKIVESISWQLIDLLSQPMIEMSIPIFQRHFEWKIENSIELLDDILNVVNGICSGHYIKNISYYFGSVIGPVAREMILIDGQQRLIVIFLTLSALRDIVQDDEFKDKVNSYIFNQDEESKNRLKLKQPYSNCKVFEAILNAEEISEEDKKTNVFKGLLTLK